MDRVGKEKEGALTHHGGGSVCSGPVSPLSGDSETTSEHNTHEDTVSVKGKAPLSQEVMDEESKAGRFGWCHIQETQYLPFIVRYQREHYISVRIIDTGQIPAVSSSVSDNLH